VPAKKTDAVTMCLCLQCTARKLFASKLILNPTDLTTRRLVVTVLEKLNSC
jgi:hypothetical protein